jgi:hypothetical protein
MKDICLLADNKLIAEFMGCRFVDEVCTKFDTGISVPDPILRKALGRSIKELKFHSSWNWLMPVVEKIENIESPYGTGYIESAIISPAWNPEFKYGCYFREAEGTNRCRKATESESNDRLIAVWAAVVKFIMWRAKEERDL